MPGPGQGKQSHKKKWRKNAHLNANIAAINTVMATSSFTNAAAPVSRQFTAIEPATTTIIETTVHPAPNEADHVDTATAASSKNDIDSQQPQPLLYTHKEVQELLEEAQLEGWREGMEEGYKREKKQGAEEMQEKAEKGQLEWYELGTQHGKEQEQRKWLAEGHGPRLCIPTMTQALMIVNT
jgi:hypothetical protein